MSIQVSALAYALFSILLAYAGSRAVPRLAERERFFIVWVLITVSLFLSTNPLVFLGLTAFILFAAKPSDRSHHLVFYIFVLHMVPIKVGALIPFPGLNYLISMNFPKLAAIVLLVPLLLRAPNELAANYKNTRLDQLVILYVVLLSALGLRNLPLTSVVRSSVDFGLLMLVPYLAARNSITSVGNMHRFVRYWVVVSVVLAVMALFMQFKFWNVYDSLSREMINEFVTIRGFRTLRDGNLRAGVVLAPAILGYALTLGVVFAQFLKKQYSGKLLQLRLAQMIFLGATYFTYSRGAWLTLLLANLLYFYLFSRSAATKAFIRLGLVFGSLIALFTTQISSFYALDPYGTFEYRMNLITNAWQVIKQNPILGSPDFMQNSILEASRQGQGIIDIVNTFLQVVLSTGLVGGVLFALIFALPVLKLGQLAKKLDSAQLFEERDLCNLVIIALLSLAVLLGTISFVGILPQYLFLFVGVAAGMIHVAKRALFDSAREAAR